MPTNEGTKTAAPRRRAAGAAATTKPAAVKTAAPKAATPKAAAKSTDDASKPVVVDMVRLEDTKSYSVFTFPADTGCVGKVYVPHGTTAVKVAFYVDASGDE